MILAALLLSLDGCPVQYATPDIDQDGQVDVPDLLMLLDHWGPCVPCECCPANINSDERVDAKDLTIVLQWWGEYSCLLYEWCGPA